MAEDHYATLGVSRDSSPQEIKRAYRRLAHQYHPDKANGDEEKFKQVNTAYQVLSDEKKRAQYDRFGQTFDGSSPGFDPFGAGGGGINFEDLGNFGVGDIFEQFFGGGKPSRSRQRRGQDASVDVSISFAASARGESHRLSHRIHQTCAHCHGNGAEPGTPINECTACHGQGTVSATQQTMLGAITRRAVCQACKGEGKMAETNCRQCGGTGRELKSRTLSVTIPAGIADGQTIRLSGKGEAAEHGNTTGDLYVTVHVEPHRELRRDGNNVLSEITVPFSDAALGTTATVETLSGPQELTIPAGTQPGSEVTLPRLGFPELNSPSSRGDHIVTVQVEIPRRLSRRQKQLLTEFKSSKRGLFR
jgi:molecular chaperone DnaJ